MLATLKADFFKQNRQKLINLANDQTIILIANDYIQKSLDQNYPFKQDNNFWYFCGIDIANLILVFNNDSQFLILPKQNKYQQIFDGSIPKTSISKQSGINEILDYDLGLEKLKAIISKNKKIGTILIPKIKHLNRINNQNQIRLLRLLKRIDPKLEINNLGKEVAGLRMIKSISEIELIKEASKITINAISKIAKEILNFERSTQIDKALLIDFLKNGSSGHSFEPIIASGKNSTIIHFNQTNSKILKNKLLLLDVGCVFNNYASDISRTVAVGNPSSRELNVLNAVKRVQEQLIKSLKPGLSFADLEGLTKKLIFEELIDLKVVTKNDIKKVRNFYPHAVTHSLGLDVHDFADYSLNLTPNMVITIEPGIYLQEEGIGVRFEDDILITNNGAKVLK